MTGAKLSSTKRGDGLRSPTACAATRAADRDEGLAMAMSPFASDEDDGMMSEINMTPLVDVMLVLLIIFLVTIPAMHTR